MRCSLRRWSPRRGQRKKGEERTRLGKLRSSGSIQSCKAALTSTAPRTQTTKTATQHQRHIISTTQGPRSRPLPFSRNLTAASCKPALARPSNQVSKRASHGHKRLRLTIITRQPLILATGSTSLARVSTSSQGRSPWITRSRAKAISSSSV